MNTILALAALMPLAAAPIDEPAPEISAEHWLNHFGQAPSLDSLRGRVVLVESWATW